jgi:hypothetical protein
MDVKTSNFKKIHIEKEFYSKNSQTKTCGGKEQEGIFGLKKSFSAHKI